MKGKFNFYNAHKGCLSIGAVLATITNENQTAEVASMMSEAKLSSAYIGKLKKY
jgi:hypothetical protein